MSVGVCRRYLEDDDEDFGGSYHCSRESIGYQVPLIYLSFKTIGSLDMVHGVACVNELLVHCLLVNSSLSLESAER